jgi:hypothetical protein
MLIGFPEGTQYGYQKGVRGRVGLFQCECGCGQTFFATWVTRAPAYANKTHRMRAYRARARERADNFDKLSHEMLGAIREAKLEKARRQSSTR